MNRFLLATGKSDADILKSNILTKGQGCVGADYQNRKRTYMHKACMSRYLGYIILSCVLDCRASARLQNNSKILRDEITLRLCDRLPKVGFKDWIDTIFTQKRGKLDFCEHIRSSLAHRINNCNRADGRNGLGTGLRILVNSKPSWNCASIGIVVKISTHNRQSCKYLAGTNCYLHHSAAP